MGSASGSLGLGKGSGSGNTTQTTDSAAANTLVALAQKFESETRGSRTGLLSAMEEVLATGGSNVPLIARAVETSRRAGSVALKDTDERLALTGLAGTPEGESIRSGTRLESEINAGNTKESLARGIFDMISNFTLGQAQTSTSGLSGAIPGMKSEHGQSTEKATGMNTGVGIGKK